VTIAIVDYGAGNLASVKKAFDHLQSPTAITSDPEQIRQADKIVLPGVGHFAATQALERSGMRDAISERIQQGIPFLGICVGMQWLLAGSAEAPGSRGMGLWDEECKSFPKGVKSPHVGWNSLQIEERPSALLRGIPSGTYVYFTHSYRVPLVQSTAASCEYGGVFAAAIERDNLFGVQFHPEKSGAAGLAILKNFCQC
jgi:imidazole glycerol-phosphate synthase subunit HisH